MIYLLDVGYYSVQSGLRSWTEAFSPDLACACVILYLLSCCRSNGGGCLYIFCPWHQTGLAGHSQAPTSYKERQKKNLPPPKNRSYWKRKGQRRGKGNVEYKLGRPWPSLLSLVALPPILRRDSFRSYASDPRRAQKL